VTTVLVDRAAIVAAVGEDLGESEWLVVDQARIDTFADAASDHQWIHVDPTLAASGPFGVTIAHGYLTLSLLTHFARQIFLVPDARLIVNSGLNRVRFITPVRVGSRVRGRAVLNEANDVGDAMQLVVATTVDIEGEERPALVAESISLYYL
jgi:acyl dehydratase